MRFLMIVMAILFSAQAVFAADCGRVPAKQIDLDAWSAKALSSPDQRWQFASVANSPDQRAVLYLKRTDGAEKWKMGSIERSGTAFWSEDSKRLLLRDQYAADDTKIHVFDVSGAVPKEMDGLNAAIRKAVFARIPKDKSTQWLYYPKVCFAANGSSTIVVTVDAPLAPRTGGSATPFRLRLAVNLATLQTKVLASGQGSRRSIEGRASDSADVESLPYNDADGYEVLSTILDARASKSRSDTVLIFHDTLTGKTFGGIGVECSTSFPPAFQGALQDFDCETKTSFLLLPKFSIRRKYKLVEDRISTVLAGTYSVSAVGFDENRTRAIVLVQYLVLRSGSAALGGDSTFYLLRKTEKGWQEAMDVSKCGRIY